MAEFKRRRNGAGYDRKKILQQGSVGLKVGRKLKQHRSQLSCGRQRRNRRQKARHEVLGTLQTLDMRDDLVRLHSKAKVGGRLLQPVLDRALLHQLAKGEIYLDRVELRRIVA